MSRIFRSKIDEQEFIKRARGLVSKEFKQFLNRGHIVLPRKDGKGMIAIPIQRMEIPHFRYGDVDTELGQGDGEIGDDLGPVDNDGDKKKGSGGQGEGEGHTIDIDISIEDFKQLFQEQLELPNIKPKGDRTIFEDQERWSTISKTGSPSLLHLPRTMREALKRSIANGSYCPPEKTDIIPQGDEFRYRSSEIVPEPKNNAVCFWLRDGSGSMGIAEIEVVNRLVTLTEFWLSCFYDRLDNVYIIHDSRALEVSREEFFSKHLGGGTTCSTALSKTLEIIGERYPVDQWNMYCTYLSDGMNYTDDNEKFGELLITRLLPILNQFNYGEISLWREWWSKYKSSGAQTFSEPGTIGEIVQMFMNSDIENIAFAEIRSQDEEAVAEAIKAFFGKGN